MAGLDEGNEPIPAKRERVQSRVGADVRQHDDVATPPEEAREHDL